MATSLTETGKPYILIGSDETESMEDGTIFPSWWFQICDGEGWVIAHSHFYKHKETMLKVVEEFFPTWPMQEIDRR